MQGVQAVKNYLLLWALLYVGGFMITGAIYFGLLWLAGRRLWVWRWIGLLLAVWFLVSYISGVVQAWALLRESWWHVVTLLFGMSYTMMILVAALITGIAVFKRRDSQ